MFPDQSLRSFNAPGCGGQPQLAIVDDQNDFIARLKT
jgi:hypothetical protein